MNIFFGVLIIFAALALLAHAVFNMRGIVDRIIAGWWVLYMLGFGAWIILLRK